MVKCNPNLYSKKDTGTLCIGGKFRILWKDKIFITYLQLMESIFTTARSTQDIDLA
jgi:hypothetical protein